MRKLVEEEEVGESGGDRTDAARRGPGYGENNVAWMQVVWKSWWQVVWRSVKDRRCEGGERGCVWGAEVAQFVCGRSAERWWVAVGVSRSGTVLEFGAGRWDC